MSIRYFLNNASDQIITIPKIAKLKPEQRAEITEEQAMRVRADKSFIHLGIILTTEGSGGSTKTKKKKTSNKGSK